MLVAAIALLSCLVIWAALISHSLREFAYSRLEEFAQRRGNIERFRAILRQQEPALLCSYLLETSGLLLLCGLVIEQISQADVLTPAGLADRHWIRLAWEYTLAGAVAVLGTVVFPWLASRVISEPVLYFSWPILAGAQLLLRPVLVTVREIDRVTHRASGRGEPEADDASVIGEEIRSVVDEGQREGIIESDAGEMITRVMGLQDEDVGAIMTPRTDIFYLQVETTLEETRQKIIEAGHSRVPVCGDSPDDILGLLYAKDLLTALGPQTTSPVQPNLRSLLREPLYIPVTTPIPSLLQLMKRQKVQIAMVLDEYGGVAGLVTMEDILEEIVGEIDDEYDAEDAPDAEFVELSPGVFDLDARMHLDDLNRKLDGELPEDGEFDTIGGFLFSQFGRVPAEGETLTWKSLRLIVVAADKRKINRVRIERDQPEAASNSVSEETTSS